MNYELAKKLKDAGFPQGDWGCQGKYWSNYDGGNSLTEPGIIDASEANFGFMEDLYRIPTLSELIEACGKCNFILADVDTHWNASGYSGSTYHIIQAVTPEEAVANLWLAFNK